MEPAKSATKCILTTVLLALAATGGASPAKTACPAACSAAVDPKAIDALERMGAYLREQPHFTLRTNSETDYILDTGQKATIAATGELRAQRPNKLRVETVSDRKHRAFFYDGTTFTIYSPNLGVYATVPVSGTLRELADTLADTYGLQLPLVDLFRWGTEESDFDLITDARYIGKARIDGVDVDQYALRQPGVDWQIWIERGARPLPRKLQLTTTDDPARPEYKLELTWDLAAPQPDSAFTFVAPKGTSKIAMADRETVRAQHELEARRTTEPKRGEAR